MWVGGLACIVFVIAALVVVVSSYGWPNSESALAAVVQDLTEASPATTHRTSCTEFGTSDLRSPSEGVWFQSNCTSAPASDMGSTSGCNRTSLDPAELTPVAPELYVYRQTPASRAYLWHSTSDTCFSLVSARVVTAVCTDQTVTFEWSAEACAAHGGVLAAINGR
jgi:hypothetical protein